MKANTLKKIEEYGLTDDDIIGMIENYYIKEDCITSDKEIEEIENKIKRFIKNTFKNKKDRHFILNKTWNGLVVNFDYMLSIIEFEIQEPLEIPSEHFIQDTICENINVYLPKKRSAINEFLFSFCDFAVAELACEDEDLLDFINEEVRKFFKGPVNKINKFIESLELTDEQKERIGWIDLKL